MEWKSLFYQVLQKKHFCYYKKRIGSAMGREGDGMCVMENWRKKWLNCWGDFLRIFKLQQSLPSCIFFQQVMTLECLYKIRTVYFFTFKIILKLGHAIQKMWKEATPCHIFITQMWLPSYAHISFLYAKHKHFIFHNFLQNSTK